MSPHANPARQRSTPLVSRMASRDCGAAQGTVSSLRCGPAVGRKLICSIWCSPRWCVCLLNANCRLPERLSCLVSAQAQIPFFRRAIRFLSSTTDDCLRRCVREYHDFIRKHGADESPALLSFGAELVWRTHLLSPITYASVRAQTTKVLSRSTEADALGLDCAGLCKNAWLHEANGGEACPSASFSVYRH